MSDIRPSLGKILQTYQRLSYSPNSAIAEFVDNSTASYFELKEIGLPVEPLHVKIEYDSNGGTLSITDNAYGMDEQTFRDALTIAKVPQNTNGRNEYGMGLKTAASWFGCKWSVQTKRRGCLKSYAATVDIEKLCQTQQNDIEISSKTADREEHYTIVTILEFNRKRKIDSRSIDKLRKELSRMYRRDINSGHITISLNGEPFSYQEPEVLVEKIDGKDVEWRKEFESKVKLDGELFPYKGFVALRKDGNRSETGFTLIRRGRVIVDGYKPREIFGEGNSFQSLRIFGEIDMDTWPVSQAKDKFDWDCDGLEELFVEDVKVQIQDYIDKSKTIRKPEKTIQEDDVRTIAISTYDDLKKLEDVDVDVVTTDEKTTVSVIDKPSVSQDNLSYSIDVKVSNYTYGITIVFVQNQMAGPLISLKEGDDEFALELSFNTSHPFFQELTSETKFTKTIQKYFIIQVIAEKILTKFNADGLVEPYKVREEIEHLLYVIVKDQLNQEYS